MGIIPTDIYAGAQFKQDGSQKTLVVDLINDESRVFFHSFDDVTGDQDVHLNYDFETFLSFLNTDGYHKIN